MLPAPEVMSIVVRFLTSSTAETGNIVVDLRVAPLAVTGSPVFEDDEKESAVVNVATVVVMKGWAVVSTYIVVLESCTVASDTFEVVELVESNCKLVLFSESVVYVSVATVVNSCGELVDWI